MATRLATTISVIACLIMIAAIACSSAPAWPAPMPTSTGPISLPTPGLGVPTGPTPDTQQGNAEHDEMLERCRPELGCLLGSG